MQNVSIQKIHDPETGLSSMMAEMDKTAEAIRRRAFKNFLERGSLLGSELDDWLSAERELIWAPTAEVSENDKEVVLQMQAPGLEPEDIEITATPESILVQSEVTHTHQESNGAIHLCEFAERMFRRFDLPAKIDVDNVTASLEKGMLRIVAVKAQPAELGGGTPPLAATASAKA